MAIVCSDLHCNWSKVEKFLAYKPEEEHVFAGDILDSFLYSFKSAMKSLQLLVESNCVLIWGNHDITYTNPKPFNCSGHVWQDAPAFEKYIADNKKRFRFAYAVDDYLITHAGVAGFLAKKDTAEEEAAYLDTEPKGIFNIGVIRGGFQKVGGPLWFDFNYEEGLSTKYNQVFGHCCLKEPKEMKGESYHHVCINTPEDAPELWVFDTKLKEVVRIDV